jgi:pantoate--beta-alanine ligase
MKIKVISSRQEWRSYCKSLTGSIGLVPTMGALHQGHLSLIKNSVKKCDHTLVTLFVNPMQFGANEDLDNYPSRLQKDIELCQEAGAVALFAPAPEEMYSDDHQTKIINDTVDKLYCGAFRDNHFTGVLTIVSKLLNLSHCTHAFFGEKDRQQLFLIQKMVKDLDMDVEIIGCPIFREESGLAMSSRNEYMSNEQKTNSAIIYKELQRVTAEITTKSWSKLKSEVSANLLANGFDEVQYFELASAQTLLPLGEFSEDAIILIAAFMGKTRLIDNVFISYSK